jgi:outer membrane protein
MQPTHRFLVLLTVTGLCFTTITAAGQTTNTLTKRLSLEDCFKLALEHNLEVRIERVNPEIARYNVSLAYAGYEPAFNFRVIHDDSQSPGGLDEFNRPIIASTSQGDSISSGVGGVLPTGLSYNVGGNVRNSSGTSSGLGFQDAGGSVSISLRQPMLKNFWWDSVRLNIEFSKKELGTSVLFLRQQIMGIVTRVEVAYYDLIAAEENVRVQEKALELAERLLAENKKRVEVGALAPLDEKQAEAQVATSRADLLLAQYNLATRQNLLKGLLSDEFSNWASVGVSPAESLKAIPGSFNLQASWLNGLTLRPDLEQLRVELDRLGIALQYQRNQLWPQLDLVGSYGRNASAADYGGFFGGIEEGRGPFYSIGAELRIPLGNRAARKNHQIVKAQKEQALLRLKKLEQDVMVAIDDAVKLARTSLERVDATKQARLFAEQALDAEEKKLANGKSTSFEVLRLQRDLTGARSAEIRALADYNVALAQLASSEGTTLERHRLNVEVK